MKKKLVCGVLISAITAGTVFTGCGNKESDSYSDVLKEINGISEGEITSEITLSIGGDITEYFNYLEGDLQELLQDCMDDERNIIISADITGILEDDGSCSSYSVKVKPGTDGSSIPFTEVIIDGDDMYINVESFTTDLSEICTNIEFADSDKKYISVTSDSMDQLLEGTGELDDIYTSCGLFFMEVFEDAMKETDVFEKDENEYSFYINESNLSDICEAAVDYMEENSDNVFNDFIDMLEDLDADTDDLIEEIKNSEDAYNDIVTGFVDGYDSDIIDTVISTYEIKFDVESIASCTGKKGKREAENSVEIYVSAFGLEISMNVETYMTEKTSETVEIPTQDEIFDNEESQVLYEGLGKLFMKYIYGDTYFYFGDFDVQEEETEDETEDESEEDTKGTDESVVPQTTVTPVADLSTDYKSGQFQLDDTVYTLPITVSELLNQGWTVSDFSSDVVTVEPDSLDFVVLNMGDKRLHINASNFTEEPVELANASVTSISAYTAYSPENNVAMCLPGGIQNGSTVAQMIAAYGEAEEVYITDISTYYTYYFDEYASAIIVKVNIETGLLDSITIEIY